jgi:hypothetical protein
MEDNGSGVTNKVASFVGRIRRGYEPPADQQRRARVALGKRFEQGGVLTLATQAKPIKANGLCQAFWSLAAMEC